MKPGGWYMTSFVTTFLYFYIYAVNYVRGAGIPVNQEEAQNIMGYIAEKVDTSYRESRAIMDDSETGDRLSRQVQQPVFPRLSMQYHNYTRYNNHNSLFG